MMIKIDYLIERDEGDKISKFEPTDFKSDLPILSYIQGPNSSGKSTLLNLIALAFFGHKLSEEELNPDLKKRVLALIDSDHQKVKFKIEVENEILGVKFVSEKKESSQNDILVRKIENGFNSPIAEDKFKREYKLIYDIPNNPLGRLPLLLYSLRDQQKDISADVVRLRQKIRVIIDEIKESKDPVQIDKLRNQLTEVEANLSNQIDNKVNQESKLQKMQEYYYSRFLLFYIDEQKEIQKKLDDLQKEIKSIKREQNNKQKAYLDLVSKIKIKISDLEQLKLTISSVLQSVIGADNKNRYKLWKTEEISNAVYHPDIYDSLQKESEYFAKFLSAMIIEERSVKSLDLDKKDLFKSLKAVLLEYENNNIKIPGTNMLIVEFISTLDELLSEIEESTSKINNIEKCSNSLERFINLLKDAIKTAELINQNKDFDNDELQDLIRIQDQEELNIRNNAQEKIIKSIRNQAIRDGFNPDELLQRYSTIVDDERLNFYNTYDEKQIQDKIANLKNKLAVYQRDITKFEKRKEDLQEELTRLESKQPHRYHDKFSEIQQILMHVQNLEKNFHFYDSWLSNLILRPLHPNNPTNEEFYYRDHIGEYLAKKIGKLIHINTTYTIKKIDVISEQLFTSEGTIINYTDLGTGQGQSAYLEGLLAMNENKKVIALFDEVAMMDENSLKPVMEKIKALYYSKKLLMAIIVQKSNQVKVEDMLCSQI